jgi:hypothetical protein
MINIDGSHESWLIYSDWLEDQDDELCHQIRAELEEDIDNWVFESRHYRGGGVGGSVGVGGSMSVGGRGVVAIGVGGVCDVGVGSDFGDFVGDNND